ncbi:YlbD family protein [Mesobacillus campisalis]
MMMAGKELHPSVKKFKEFVKGNPKIIQEVRDGKATWQELYEEWYLLGEEDERWDPYREGERVKEGKAAGEKEGDWMSKMITAFKGMDPDQIQGQIYNISQAIAAVQGVLAQFTGGQASSGPGKEGSRHPFEFRKD